MKVSERIRKSLSQRAALQQREAELAFTLQSLNALSSFNN